MRLMFGHSLVDFMFYLHSSFFGHNRWLCLPELMGDVDKTVFFLTTVAKPYLNGDYQIAGVLPLIL